MRHEYASYHSNEYSSVNAYESVLSLCICVQLYGNSQANEHSIVM
jgi:hypothetical protein